MKQPTRSSCSRDLRALIVGGGRGMGAWMARLLRDQGIGCCICDVHAPSIDEMVKQGYDARHYSGDDARPFLDENDTLPFDMLILAVPIEQLRRTAEVFCCHCQNGSLVMDVCSTKTDPLTAMDLHTPSGCEVLGTHPLFGPKIYPPVSQTWILTPSLQHPPITWEARIKSIVNESGALLYATTAAAHDEAMQIVQVGTHLTLLVFGTFLDYAHRSFNELQNFKTPIFELLSSLASRVYAQNPALYFNIQKQPNAEATQDLFREALSRMQALLANGTLEEFTSHHERVKECIGETNVVALDHVVSSAIRTLANERKLLRTSLGEVVCVRNIESGKIHHGLLHSIDPPVLSIKKKKETVPLSLKKVRLLSSQEKYAWLIETGKVQNAVFRLLVPPTATGHTIASQLVSVPGVINAVVVDEYVTDNGGQEKKLTIRVTVDPDIKGDSIINNVHGLLGGLGYTSTLEGQLK